MLKIDRSRGKLISLKTESLTSSHLTERSDLQELIFQNAEEFFDRECEEHIFVLAQEVRPSPEVGDRIDLLGIDAEGKTVIIELKRGSHKLQLLQALSYSSMVWEMSSQMLEELVVPSRRTAYDTFMFGNGVDQEELNSSQRIMLVAESYDFEVLQTARWLTENHGVNITCYELALAQDQTANSEYLSAVQLYPPKRLAEQARQRGAMRSQEENKFPTLEEWLKKTTNSPVKSFFEEWLTWPRRNRRQDSIVLPSSGKMRFRFTSRKDYARITQLGRFVGDESKWSALAPGTIRVKPNGLRFRLSTSDSLQAFRRFAVEDMPTLAWGNEIEGESVEEDDLDD